MSPYMKNADIRRAKDRQYKGTFNPPYINNAQLPNYTPPPLTNQPTLTNLILLPRLVIELRKG